MDPMKALKEMNRRKKIAAAMKGNRNSASPKTEEHKERIAKGMRWNQNARK